MTGELIGRGRDCDVFEAGTGRVLRRNRDGRSTEVEALTMRHCETHGYPVPEVFDADGSDIVMQRLDGPTMLAEMSARPWTMRAKARQLAELVEQLGRIPLPDHELPRCRRRRRHGSSTSISIPTTSCSRTTARS